MVVANVDIPALKARHPLGDVLDFIRESEGLSLRRPSRGWTTAQGLHPGPLIVQPDRGVLRPPRLLPETPPC